jgi:hypothetical protein
LIQIFKDGCITAHYISTIDPKWRQFHGIDVVCLISQLAHGFSNSFVAVEVILIGDSTINYLSQPDPHRSSFFTVACYPGGDLREIFHVLRAFLPNPLVSAVLIQTGCCDLTSKVGSVISYNQCARQKFQRKIERNVEFFFQKISKSIANSTRFGFFSVPHRFKPDALGEMKVDKDFRQLVVQCTNFYRLLSEKFRFVFLVEVNCINGYMMRTDGIHMNYHGDQVFSGVVGVAARRIVSTNVDCDNVDRRLCF